MGFEIEEQTLEVVYKDEVVGNNRWYVVKDVVDDAIYTPLGEDGKPSSIDTKLTAEWFCRYLLGIDDMAYGVVGYRKITPVRG